eukprot:7382901-Prymnesium_polylepis.2
MEAQFGVGSHREHRAAVDRRSAALDSADVRRREGIREPVGGIGLEDPPSAKREQQGQTGPDLDHAVERHPQFPCGCRQTSEP